ncbi:MAG: HpsJ family protein [Microcoleaceae cyanobacterium]
MNAMTSRQFSSQITWNIKIVGIILIVSALVDYLILAIPPNLSNRSWQLTTATQLVDRGIVPLVGMALVLIGSWMDHAAAGGTQKPTKPLLDLRFWVAIIACVLGLMYLLLFPLHLNNTRIARAEALSQINQQATQAETRLESQLGSNQFQQQVEDRKTQLRSQFSNLLQNQEQLSQILEQENLPQQVRDVLQEAQTNPAVLDQFLEEQADNLPTQLLTQIRERKQQLEEQAKGRSLKSSLQTGLSSLFLAIGYIAVGWTGIKSLGLLGGSRRKVSPS